MKQAVATHFLASIMVFSGTVGGGCGSGLGAEDTGSNADGGLHTTHRKPDPSACDAFATVFCTLALGCCASVGITNRTADQIMAGCRAIVMYNADSFDPIAGQQCLDQLRQTTPGGPCFPLVMDGPCDQLYEAHSGSGGPNAPCQLDGDCAQPAGGISRCNPSSRRCQWMLPGSLGASPCVGELDVNGHAVWETSQTGRDYLCRESEHLYCYQHQECRPQAELGASCMVGINCLSGSCPGSTCVAPAAIGDDCASAPCAAGYCD